MNWRLDAACGGADLRLFFGPDEEHPADKAARESAAKAICAGCPVRLRCLNFAIRKPVTAGVWGGTGEGERRNLRRRWLGIQRQQERRAA